MKTSGLLALSSPHPRPPSVRVRRQSATTTAVCQYFPALSFIRAYVKKPMEECSSRRRICLASSSLRNCRLDPERNGVLSGFFWMLTLWTHTRYTESPKAFRSPHHRSGCARPAHNVAPRRSNPALPIASRLFPNTKHFSFPKVSGNRFTCACRDRGRWVVDWESPAGQDLLLVNPVHRQR